MAAGKSRRINRQYKTKYRIRNWREYERGLRSRGDVTIWLSEDAIAAWRPPKNGLRGGQRRYSNLAIRTALTLRVARIFQLPAEAELPEVQVDEGESRPLTTDRGRQSFLVGRNAVQRYPIIPQHPNGPAGSLWKW